MILITNQVRMAICYAVVMILNSLLKHLHYRLWELDCLEDYEKIQDNLVKPEFMICFFRKPEVCGKKKKKSFAWKAADMLFNNTAAMVG